MFNTKLHHPSSPPRLPSSSDHIRGFREPTRLNQIELAHRWSLSPRTLEAWRWRGEGPAYLKIKGRIVYRLQDVEAYEEANLVQPVSARPGAGRKVGTP